MAGRNNLSPGEVTGKSLLKRRIISVCATIIIGFVVLTAFDYFTNGHHIRFTVVNIVIPVVVGILEDILGSRSARKRLAKQRSMQESRNAQAEARARARAQRAKQGTGGSKNKKKKKR